MDTPQADYNWLKADDWEKLAEIKSDQQLKKPYPPLQKPARKVHNALPCPPLTALSWGR